MQVLSVYVLILAPIALWAIGIARRSEVLVAMPALIFNAAAIGQLLIPMFVGLTLVLALPVLATFVVGHFAGSYMSKKFASRMLWLPMLALCIPLFVLLPAWIAISSASGGDLSKAPDFAKFICWALFLGSTFGIIFSAGPMGWFFSKRRWVAALVGASFVAPVWAFIELGILFLGMGLSGNYL